MKLPGEINKKKEQTSLHDIEQQVGWEQGTEPTGGKDNVTAESHAGFSEKGGELRELTGLSAWEQWLQWSKDETCRALERHQ